MLRMVYHLTFGEQSHKMEPKVRAGSSVGRAPALQAGGHRFNPCSAYQPILPLQNRSLDLKVLNYEFKKFSPRHS